VRSYSSSRTHARTHARTRTGVYNRAKFSPRVAATLEAQVQELEQHVKAGRREFDERLMSEKGGG